MDPVALVGFAFKLPQEAVDDDSFWEVLESRRSLMTDWPSSRGNIDAYYDAESNKQGTMITRGAHFLAEDPAAFDAPFFAITAKEASSMDPQQRIALETTYHAFENAGLPLESLSGSDTAVYFGSLSTDYARMLLRDIEVAPRATLSGTEVSLLPNRISWYFNLKGPSIHVNTACSSSLVALDSACQSLRSGDASAAVVIGSSYIFGPDSSILLSAQGFLSPDGVCYSFDDRADGYARGEGILAVVIKPLADALQNGDVIRGVIRATGSNQDGKTPTLTQPSVDAQETLIRRVYEKAGVDFSDTRYFEAHGTGTAVGDPIEAKAIGRVFGSSRSADEPLYVGSVKSNIGHVGGGSGLAGVIKSVLALERGIVPPQALFRTLNPAIDAELYSICIPQESIPWPSSAVRRVSINSFGVGGSNAHVIIDDACNFLQARGIGGYHNCATKPDSPGTSSSPETIAVSTPDNQSTEGSGSTPSSEVQPMLEMPLRLLVWSAADAGTLGRLIDAYDAYIAPKIDNALHLNRLAYTLSNRRTHLPWRAYTVLRGDQVAAKETSPLSPSQSVRSSAASLRLGFVFTGQGAQYKSMGCELMQYQVFRSTLQRVDDVLKSLGCPWSLFEGIIDESRISSPEYSQPLCTALQIALVELFRSFGISPVAAVGHSSGEIAAAYTVGALSLESATKVAYYRGVVAKKLQKSLESTPGAMMSVALGKDDLEALLQGMKRLTNVSASVACLNSPSNCTVSGDKESLDHIKGYLDQNSISCQMLRTGIAYHSPAMSEVSADYQELLTELDARHSKKKVFMSSSVTGEAVTDSTVLSTPRYWAQNLVSPVRFAEALRSMVAPEYLALAAAEITDLIEVGPHGALRRPILETLASMPTAKANTAAGTYSDKVRYQMALHRDKSPVLSVLEMMGNLFCHGLPVDIASANMCGGALLAPLIDCPQYPFDHTRKYWDESRRSQDFRMQGPVDGVVIGKRAMDWNDTQPSFRNLFSIERLPWLQDHVISDKIICPGTAMIIMAIEGIKSLLSTDVNVSGFLIKEAYFLRPITIAEDVEDYTEVYLSIHREWQASGKAARYYNAAISANDGKASSECFQSRIEVVLEDLSNQVDKGQEDELEKLRILNMHDDAGARCKEPVDKALFYSYLQNRGIRYGPSFSILSNMRWDGGYTCVASIDVASMLAAGKGCPVHPAVLDAALHLAFAPISQAARRPDLPTLVPSRLENYWLSSQVWKQPAGDVHLSTSVSDNNENGWVGSVNVIAQDGTVLCAGATGVLVPVAKDEADDKPGGAGKGSCNIFKMERKPLLSGLPPAQVRQLCGPSTIAASEGELNLYKNTELACAQAARHAISHIEETGFDISQVPDNLQRLYHALRLQYGGEEGETEPSWADTLELLTECETESPPLRLFAEAGRHLESVLRNETDPLELLITSGAAELSYTSIFTELCDSRLRHFLELASHETPGLRILEVGAGTGGMTQHVVSALVGLEERTGSAHFAEYVYTDISPAFFEAASAKFSHLGKRIKFAKLDLEKDPSSSGLDMGSYDIVLAGCVLHTTSCVAVTLQNVRAFLKPGGHLAMIEVSSTDFSRSLVGFGSLPGWFGASEEWRQNGPLVSPSKWEELLADNGFVSEPCMRVNSAEGATLTVSRASESPGSSGCEQRSLIVLVDEDATVHQQHTADQLSRQWPDTQLITLSRAHETSWSDEHTVVSLLEVGRPRLPTLSATDFAALKAVIKKTQSLMWVSLPLGRFNEAASTLHAACLGFLRTVRSEDPTRHVVTLTAGLGGVELTPESVERFVSQVLVKCFDKRVPSSEIELYVDNDQVCADRLISATDMYQDARTRQIPALQTCLWKDEPPAKLSVGTPGILDTLQLVEQPPVEILGDNEIEIETRAWPLSFRDVLIAVSRLKEDSMGADCAGVVRRVGTKVSSFKAGDRVCACSMGAMQAIVHASSDLALRIPEHISFAEAATSLAPGMTAYHALVNVARLRPTDKILIHSGAGSTGQMAIHIAKAIGAEIFATVGFDEKKRLLIEEFGIPEDHIFYSRNLSFAKAVMRMTAGRGVDVILNSLAGDGLRASWECMAPFGHFLEIGKADIIANAQLPMAKFAKNVTFTAIDLAHIAVADKALASSLMSAVAELTFKGSGLFPKPIHAFPVTQAESAFRYMQSGKNTGRIVITMDPHEQVSKLTVKRGTWSFDDTSSYIVPGGLGGIGREVLSWMVERGAKNLIVPSRSGASSTAAQALVHRLRAKQVNIRIYKCNIGLEAELERLLFECKDMPPIKGCINAAMALQDATLDSMAHKQWERTIQSKIHSSRNLHSLLPKQLDFFILLSSICGVCGNTAQANYAAGCTYQDALARCRSNAGFKSVSIDMSPVRDAGYVAENITGRLSEQLTEEFESMHSQDLLAALDYYCDPTVSVPSPDDSQIVYGIMSERNRKLANAGLSEMIERLTFAHFSITTSDGAGEHGGEGQGSAENLSFRFQSAKDHQSRAEVVVSGLVDKLARALSVSVQYVDPSRPLSEYGVDSLMAVELRNWIRREFKATVAIFDILGPAVSIQAVGDLVSQNSDQPLVAADGNMLHRRGVPNLVCTQ